MISTQISLEIAGSRAEARKKYIEELRACIVFGVASKQLNKLSNVLGYSPEQISKDELNIIRTIELQDKLAVNATDMGRYDIEFVKIFEELQASNKANEEAFKKNQFSKMSFLTLQNQGNRMLGDKLKITQELEGLQEYV